MLMKIESRYKTGSIDPLFLKYKKLLAGSFVYSVRFLIFESDFFKIEQVLQT